MKQHWQQGSGGVHSVYLQKYLQSHQRSDICEILSISRHDTPKCIDIIILLYASSLEAEDLWRLKNGSATNKMKQQTDIIVLAAKQTWKDGLPIAQLVTLNDRIALKVSFNAVDDLPIIVMTLNGNVATEPCH